MKKSQGFTLIELILTLAVGATISFLSFQNFNKDFENKKSVALGEQIKNIGTGVNNYIVNHYDVLSKLESSTGTTQDPGPRTCNSYNRICEITTQTLVNEGMLPPVFSNKNIYGSGYKILISRKGSSPYWNISAVITTDAPLLIGGAIRYDLLGKAMQSAGLDSGITKTSATQIDGYKGSWAATTTDYPNINQQGLLAYIAGYGSNSYSAFLRRDGTLPMTGDLNMGGNNINNAKNITASGNASFGGTGEFGNNLAVRGMSSSNQPPGYLGGVIAPDYYAQAGIYIAKNGKEISDTDWAFRANRDGYLEVSGNINAGKNITAGNWVIAHNGGGNTMYIGGDNAVAADGTIGNDYEIKMDTAKTLTVWNTALSSDRAKRVLDVWGSQRVAGNLSVESSNTADGDITASGNIKGKTVESTGRTTIGEYAQINGIATLGKECELNGLQGRTQEGAILSCVNKVWKNVLNVQVYTSADVGAYGTGYGSVNIGAHSYCALSQTRFDYNNYRACIVSPNNNGTWTLTATKTGSGQADCVATCF
ncbi:shufflon system plasmid conjugative transfer pilus tip adhesin PilV [Salmonella enterica subsp. enterica]|nr:shufflon system plasmid conjugative transfer pilus tip adhesin PilV [Salmonella enterica subsp. enterica]